MSGSADDPYLDLDDIWGTGPENINIAAPYPDLYHVGVHDHPFNAYTGANPTTVTSAGMPGTGRTTGR